MVSFNTYHYGDTGAYGPDHPSYALTLPGASDYLARLAHEQINPDLPPNTIEALMRTGLLAEEEGVWRLPFPFFLEQDIPLLDRLLEEPVRQLAHSIGRQSKWIYREMENLNLAFEPQRLLYHCLCDRVFDGTAFDWLQAKIRTGKLQPNGRDYLPIGFEDTAAMIRLADRLLCSSHNMTAPGMTWNSFGDGDGTRHCLVRLTRVVAKSPEKLTSFVGMGYDWFLADTQEAIVRLSHILKRLWEDAESNVDCDEQAAVAFLQALGYIDAEKRLLIPVFATGTQNVIQNLTQGIMPLAEEQFDRVISSLHEADYTLQAMRHGVAVYDLGNELWHQLFGRVNEKLVAEGLVASPPYYEGQGRYFKSIILC